MTLLPTIRERLLRIHLVVAFVAVMVFFIFGSMLDWQQTQQTSMRHFTDNMQAAARGAAGYVQARDQHGLAMHMRDFQGLPGMMALCVYGGDGQVMNRWESASSTESCPQFILSSGMQRSLSDASTAIALMHNKTYLGMLYAKSRLVYWQDVALKDAVALLGLLLVAYLACRLSSRYGAHAITASLTALKEQLDCLKNDDYAQCPLLPPMTTVETATLAQSVAEFRSHLALNTLPRKELKQFHHWYEQLFYGLLRSLRQRLGEDSPLLQHLDDYELLMRIKSGEPLPEPIAFDIAKLLRSTVQHVRQQYPENPTIALNVSLQSTMQHEWLGQPKMLSMLLQHLLLIALGRTRQGAVYLRLSLEENAEDESTQLSIKLEDSGPHIQRWQLVKWLSGTEEIAGSEALQDISWLISGQLLRYLGGKATAETGPRGGLIATLSLPIQRPQASSPDMVYKLPNAIGGLGLSGRPLLMVVEASVEKQQELLHLFQSLQCAVFIVEDHAQAMVWAPVLPFAALMLNGALPDARSLVVKRLQHLAEENLMPHIPLWAMVPMITVTDEKHWHDVGVSTLFTQPLKRTVLEPLCAALRKPSADFYMAYDTHLQDDFPANIVTRLPELNREIGRQLRQLHGLLLTLPENTHIASICQQAHAVKSAALSLGYFRLAALMAEIEHALASKTFERLPHQWRIIADMLDPAIFEQPQRASA